MEALRTEAKGAFVKRDVVEMEVPPRRVPWSSRFARRYGAIENAPPVVGLVKSLLDPVAISLVLFLVAYFELGEVSGLIFSMGVLAVLLSGYLLEGRLLFLQGKGFGEDIASFLIGWAGVVMMVVAIGIISGYADLVAPSIFVQWVIFTPLVLLLLHASVFWRLKSLAGSGSRALESIIVGANLSGRALANEMTRHPLSRLKFLGFCDDRDPERLDLPEGKLLARLADLPEFVHRHKVDRIYITLSMTSQPRTLALIEALKDTTTSVYFVPDMFVFDCIQARFDEVGGIPVISVCESPFDGLSGLSKRVSDVVLATLILCLIWPLLIIIGAAVKLTSQGPAVFVQRRYGLDGKEINVYKFRTMTVMEDGDAVKQATRNDTRLTPIGGFLRRTSLDELPQFINVLQGRMSVVGPRPHANTHNELYRKLIKGYMVRHKVRPGITGLAQVNGARGETDTLDKMERRIELDLAYLRHWSVWLDLKIVLKTIIMAACNRQAY